MQDNCSNHNDVLRRLDVMEADIDNLRDSVNCLQLDNKSFDTINVKIENIEKSLQSTKGELLQVVANHTDKTWQLIYNGVKIIVVLVVAIIAFTGVKLAPEIIKMVGGI